MRKGVQQGLAVQRTPDLLVQDATLRLAGKDFIAARQAAEEALRTAPDDIRALDVLARSYSEQKQSQTAMEKLREYAAKELQSSTVQLYLGRWLQAQGDVTGARAALTAAKAADSNSADTDLALAQLDLMEGKWGTARKGITAILGRNSRNITARYWLAQVERIEGNDKASIEEYRKVIAADPTNTNALNNLAVLLGEQGDQGGEAMTLAQRAKELAPDNPAIADTWGWLLYRNGLYKLAVRQLEEANSRHSTALRASHLSMAYFKSGSPERARQMLQQAVTMDPNLPDVKQAKQLLAASATGPDGGQDQPRRIPK
jgi:Tfp pilus assembly protein PilF